MCYFYHLKHIVICTSICFVSNILAGDSGQSTPAPSPELSASPTPSPLNLSGAVIKPRTPEQLQTMVAGNNARKQARITAYNNIFASNPQFTGYHMDSQGNTINPSGVIVAKVWDQLAPDERGQVLLATRAASAQVLQAARSASAM